MTLRTLYRPTRLSQPLPRGPVFLAAAVGAWLGLILVVQGLAALLQAVLS